jgi:FHS family glucose/mannose:H+ symporter-like MFS transporter
MRVKILLHFIFFLSGIATVFIGAVLPILSAKFALNDLQAGNFFPAQLAGSLTGTYLTDWFGKKGKLGMAAWIGGFTMAGGLLLMNFDSYAVCMLGFLINGLGVGLTLPAINILILEMNPTRSAAALNILNFFWGVGAIVSKPFVDLTSAPTSIIYTTVVLSIPLLIGAALLLIFDQTSDEPVGIIADDASETLPIWRMPIAWMIAFFNFIHVGFESGMGGWITSYSERVETSAAIGLISPTLLYFLFFVIGRGTAPVFVRFLSTNAMLLASLFVILGGLLITISAETITGIAIGSAITGFGTSTVFPTNVSRFSETFGPGSMRRAMPLFICGTLGSMVVTWLIGYVSDATGNLRSGMAVLVFSIVVLILVQIILSLKNLTQSRKGAKPQS